MTKSQFPINGADPTSSSTSVRTGYRVQARFNYINPAIILGVAYGKEWCELNISPGMPGHDVAMNPRHTALHAEGLFSLEEAEALRWQFLAAAAAERQTAFCLETRIVAYRVTVKTEVLPVAYIDPRDARGDVPEDMRDMETVA